MTTDQAITIAEYVSKHMETAKDGDEAAMILHSFAYAMGCQLAGFEPESQAFLFMKLTKAMGEALIDFSAKTGISNNITIVERMVN